jgi:hypothetical protein
MQYRLGENAKLYYAALLATSTTYTLPSTVADNVKDVKVVAKHDTPEFTTRANNGVKQYAASLSDLGVTFQIKVPGAGTTDAAYTAFRDAFKNKTEIAAYALSDAKTESGAEGPAGNFIVSSFDREEGNGQVQFVSVELKPSSFNAWHVVA